MMGTRPASVPGRTFITTRSTNIWIFWGAGTARAILQKLSRQSFTAKGTAQVGQVREATRAGGGGEAARPSVRVQALESTAGGRDARRGAISPARGCEFALGSGGGREAALGARGRGGGARRRRRGAFGVTRRRRLRRGCGVRARAPQRRAVPVCAFFYFAALRSRA